MLQGWRTLGHVSARHKCGSPSSLVFLQCPEVAYLPRKKYDRQRLYMFQYFGGDLSWNKYLHRSLFDGKTGQLLRFGKFCSCLIVKGQAKSSYYLYIVVGLLNAV